MHHIQASRTITNVSFPITFSISCYQMKNRGSSCRQKLNPLCRICGNALLPLPQLRRHRMKRRLNWSGLDQYCRNLDTPSRYKLHSRCQGARRRLQTISSIVVRLSALPTETPSSMKTLHNVALSPWEMQSAGSVHSTAL